MRLTTIAISTFTALIAMTAQGSAASLQVSPTFIEVPAPRAASTIRIKNPGQTAIKAQIRVFRWTLVNGEEKLEPATDVVASPPIATLQPKADYVVRIVRTSKQPVAVEETYRLLVDEIPELTKNTGFTIAMAFRYSIPVFFTPQAGGVPDMKWSVQKKDGKTYVSATNSGNRRIRVADLTVTGADGKSVVIGKGLAGYVLARSSKSWVAPSAMGAGGSSLVVSAKGDLGPINARTTPDTSR